MKIEEGKYYITDGGYRVGPMVRTLTMGYPWKGKVSGCNSVVRFNNDGQYDCSYGKIVGDIEDECHDFKENEDYQTSMHSALEIAVGLKKYKTAIKIAELIIEGIE